MMFRAANRNKRSMVLDLKQPGSAAIVERLARWADIVIETSRPGVAARIGIGFEKLAEYNPRLIYCSLSGYGQNGPWRERPRRRPRVRRPMGAPAGPLQPADRRYRRRCVRHLCDPRRAASGQPYRPRYAARPEPAGVDAVLRGSAAWSGGNRRSHRPSVCSQRYFRDGRRPADYAGADRGAFLE
jgi:hypothetical protein